VACTSRTSQLVGDGPFTAHVGRERVSVPSAPARSTWV